MSGTVTEAGRWFLAIGIVVVVGLGMWFFVKIVNAISWYLFGEDVF